MDMDNNKTEQILAIVLSITGIVIAVDVMLYHLFDIGTQQNNFTIIYCVAIVLTNIKYPNILKKRYVIYPLYILVAQTIYSLVKKYL